MQFPAAILDADALGGHVAEKVAPAIAAVCPYRHMPVPGITDRSEEEPAVCEQASICLDVPFHEFPANDLLEQISDVRTSGFLQLHEDDLVGNEHVNSILVSFGR